MNYSVYAESVPMFSLCEEQASVYIDRNACIINLLVFHSFLFFTYLSFLSICLFIRTLMLIFYTFISPSLKLWLHEELVLWIHSYFVCVNDRVEISIVFCEREKNYMKLVRVC